MKDRHRFVTASLPRILNKIFISLPGGHLVPLFLSKCRYLACGGQMADRRETFARFNFSGNRGSTMQFKGRRKSKERHGFLLV